MDKKINYIVREVPAEQTNFSFYFDDDGLTEAGGDYCNNLFIVNYGRHSRGFNDKEYENLQTEIEELFEKYDDIINKYEHAQYSSVGLMLLDLGLIDNIHHTKRIKDIKEWLKDCQEPTVPTVWRSYTTRADTEPEKTTAEYLTFKTGKQWTTEVVRGYSQGDMVTLVYCPEHYTDGAKAYGEIWLGAGKEFYTIELDENGEEGGTCYGYIIADCQVRNDEDYKRLVCEWACIPEDETRLEMIDGYKTVVRYDYKTI